MQHNSLKVHPSAQAEREVSAMLEEQDLAADRASLAETRNWDAELDGLALRL